MEWDSLIICIVNLTNKDFCTPLFIFEREINVIDGIDYYFSFVWLVQHWKQHLNT